MGKPCEKKIIYSNQSEAEVAAKRYRQEVVFWFYPMVSYHCVHRHGKRRRGVWHIGHSRFAGRDVMTIPNAVMTTDQHLDIDER